MIFAAKSDKGSVRPINEDAFYTPQNGERLFIVADGMGGHQAGEVASRMAVDIVSQRMLLSLGHGFTPGEMLLRRSVLKANSEIYDASQRTLEYSGMGTTLTMMFIHKGTAYLAHVGDSRAYIVHEGSLLPLTSDHSLIEELVKRGALTREAAARHPYRNIVTRSLGTEPSVSVDTSSVRFKAGDRLLLCTDGLTNLLDNKELLNIIISDEPAICVEGLINAALGRGGHDNITAILAQAEEGDL